ncbi:MAG: alpha/beta hydrolase [Deltaproteobacteria bacterium]|nr:alpha/beta hydrolase [Deltaproteobacteria bacterium]
MNAKDRIRESIAGSQNKNRLPPGFCILHYGFFIFAILIFTAGCSSLFFYPQKELLDNPALKQVSYEDVYFMTADGVKLHGWHLKAKDKSRGIILQLHGNAENISTHVNSVLWLTLEGYDVFTFDYRGYGKSEGSPTLDGVHRDAEAALETALKLPDINRKRIFVLGQSLGGAIAVYTIAASPYKNHVKAVILDSAFSSYRDIAREKLAGFILTWPFQYPLSLLFNDYYSPVKWIKNVYPLPILIIQGDQDTIVPPHHALILYEAALNPKELWLVNGAGHIQAFAVKDIRERFLQYLRGIK